MHTQLNGLTCLQSHQAWCWFSSQQPAQLVKVHALLVYSSIRQW